VGRWTQVALGSRLGYPGGPRWPAALTCRVDLPRWPVALAYRIGLPHWLAALTCAVGLPRCGAS